MDHLLSLSPHETALESNTRKAHGFHQTELKLEKRFSLLDLHFEDFARGFIDKIIPSPRSADPATQDVWVLDNTAFKPDATSGAWVAEFVACFFYKDGKDLAKHVAVIADEVKLDGAEGRDTIVQKRIEERLLPFLQVIAPSYTIDVDMPQPKTTTTLTLTLGPSNLNGISSQIMSVPAGNEGVAINGKDVEDSFEHYDFTTHYAEPHGWAVISDIDDTIKVTGSVDPIAILRTTFTEEPQTTPGMPEFYKSPTEKLHPMWFYLSASPYNLYPFLRPFVRKHYPHGTMILRDASWQYLGGLLQSLTQGVQAYKCDRMHKIHSWLPERKFVCIGDSTQSDPEAYAEIYKTYPGWVKAIFIRKVLDPAPLVGKNDPERFTKAFEGIGEGIWKVFESPEELEEAVERLVASGAI